MKLYGFPHSPNTWKVRAVAAHIELPIDFVFVDLTKGQQRGADYLALNPTGRTPTLVDGAFTLRESNAIMQYIAGKTQNTLWPGNPATRASIAQWQSWQLAHWAAEACKPVIFERVVKTFLKLGAPDPAVVSKGLQSFDVEARVLESHLSKQPYLVENALTLADFSVAAPLFLAKEAALPLEAYPHVQDWFGRVSALPAWRETSPALAVAA